MRCHLVETFNHIIRQICKSDCEKKRKEEKIESNRIESTHSPENSTWLLSMPESTTYTSTPLPVRTRSKWPSKGRSLWSIRSRPDMEAVLCFSKQACVKSYKKIAISRASATLSTNNKTFRLPLSLNQPRPWQQLDFVKSQAHPEQSNSANASQKRIKFKFLKAS